jgi:hypothetical protein
VEHLSYWIVDEDGSKYPFIYPNTPYSEYNRKIHKNFSIMFKNEVFARVSPGDCTENVNNIVHSYFLKVMRKAKVDAI